MKNLAPLMVILAPLLAVALGEPALAAPNATEAPVQVVVSVEPASVAAGSDAVATIKLAPKPGIKLNKYPRIKIQIPAEAGVVGAAEGSIGNTAPPAPDNLDANYYHGEIDPLNVTIHVDAAASHGRHDVAAKLSYFYCVAASGYCAPAKVAVSVPITIR